LLTQAALVLEFAVRSYQQVKVKSKRSSCNKSFFWKHFCEKLVDVLRWQEYKIKKIKGYVQLNYFQNNYCHEMCLLASPYRKLVIA